MFNRECHQSPGQRKLTLAPLAWLKLQYFCHLGPTEIAGFGITSATDLLYVEDFVTVRQFACCAFVAMEDDAVADFTDRCIDAGLKPHRFLRIWCHTHPGFSPEPRGHDEDTFARVFGSCDWAVMFIMSRSSQTYARLSLSAGPGLTSQLTVAVDWSAWPRQLADPQFSMANLLAAWQAEFAAHIQTELTKLTPSVDESTHASPWEPFADGWDWPDLETSFLQEMEYHDRLLHEDVRS